MSVRNFSRAFTGEYGVTPARFVERLRVETAERLMRDSEKSVKELAAECGFRSVDTLRRALKRTGKAAPSQLRDQTTSISVQH
jgi:transcriptional regulator GlxA family with amidase domain